MTEQELSQPTGPRATAFSGSVATELGPATLASPVAASPDLTQRALRESEARFRSAFENAPIGLALVALDGRFLRVNAELCRLLGYTHEDLLNESSLALTHPDDIDDNLARVWELLQGRISRFDIEKRYVRADGTPVWVRHSVSLVRDNSRQPLYFIAQIQDDSERRRTLDELARSNNELERFATTASHDLQEPLRKITTFAERLETRLDDILDDQSRTELGRIHDAADRMKDLTRALLVYSKVTTAPPRRKPIDLGLVLDGVISDLEVHISETGCRLEVSALPTIEADVVQIRQLFQNLLCNAIKFRTHTETPLVEIGSGEQTGNMVTLTISDNGIGFDEKHRERIFEPFQRLHGSESYAGTGIGLALCRRVVERHGGSLTASSTPGRGSKFTIALPVLGRHAEAKSESA